MSKICGIVGKNGYEKSRYFEVVLDNKQTINDAISIVKSNASKLGLSPLAYIGRSNVGVRPADQYNKLKPGTILDGDWNSYSFGEILVEGGK